MGWAASPIRRCVAAVVVLALVTPANPAATGERDSTKQTHAYQVNLKHDGNARVDVVPPLRLAWHKSFGGVGYPIVVGNRVYAIVGRRGNLRRPPRLTAFAAKTGRRLWSQPVGATGAFATYSNGRLFTLTRYGALTAFDARSGGVLWEKDLARMTPQHMFGSMPAATRRRIYVGGAGQRSQAFALSTRNGRLVWKSRRFHPVGAADVTVAGRRVFFGLEGPSVTVLRRRTGRKLWSYNAYTGGASGMVPVFNQGRLYLRAGLAADVGHVVDIERRRRVARFESRFPPATDGRTALFVTRGRLIARRAPAGRKLWVFDGDRRLALGPVIAGGYAFVASRRGKVFAVDIDTGRRRWRGELGHATFLYNNGSDAMGLAVGDGIIAVPAYGRDRETHEDNGHLFVFTTRS